MIPQQPSSPSPSPAAADALLEHESHVLQAIRETSFGTVEIVVHQSRIVQITRSEKQRFDSR